MFLECRGRVAIVVGLLFCSSIAAFDEAEKKEMPVEEVGRAFVALLEKGDFDKATGDFSKAMLNVLPADKLKDIWEKIVGTVGAFQKQLSREVEKDGRRDVVIVTCQFEKTIMDLRVIFDKDSKITGFSYGPHQLRGEEEIFEGTSNSALAKFRLFFRLYKQKDSTYLGTMDNPDQGAKGIPLDHVSIKDEAVRLELKGAKLLYEGKRAKGGNEIVGKLKVDGRSVPFKLKKIAKPVQSRD